MRRRKRTVSAGEALQGALKAVGQQSLFTLARIELNWSGIVGSQLAAVSHPADIVKGELIVWVKEPVWVDSISYMKRKLIANINASLGAAYVTEVRIVRKTWDTPEVEGEEESGSFKDIPYPDDAIEEAEKAVANVTDPELRSSLKRVMLKSLKAKLQRKRP